MVLNRRQRRSRYKFGSVQEQALDATFSFVELVNQRLWLGPLLLRNVEVYDILGDIFELAKLLLQTRISNKQLQKHAHRPTAAHAEQFHNNR
jgi:hypothetical protein